MISAIASLIMIFMATIHHSKGATDCMMFFMFFAIYDMLMAIWCELRKRGDKW